MIPAVTLRRALVRLARATGWGLAELLALDLEDLGLWLEAAAAELQAGRRG